MHPLTVYHTWNFTGVLEMRALVNSSVPFGGAAKHPQVHQQAVVAVESCCHEPRVEAVRCHPGPIEKSRQFSREQDVLMGVAKDDPEGQARVAAFQQGLADLNWADGRNVHIEYRWAAGDVDRIPDPDDAIA